MKLVGGIFGEALREALRHYKQVISEQGWEAGESLIGKYAFDLTEPEFPKYCKILRILLRAEQIWLKEERGEFLSDDSLCLLVEINEINVRQGSSASNEFLLKNIKDEDEIFSLGMMLVFFEAAKVDIK